jgi:hypothetical protein
METIKCGACGEENRLQALYCRKCGAKLDYGKAEKALLREGRWRAAAAFGRFLRGVLLLAVLAVLGLALWPEGRTVKAGGAVDARRYAMTRALLEDALDRGASVEMEVAARDFNAFLARNVQDAGAGGAWAAKYRGAGVAFGEGRGEAWLEMERGPLTLTCGCEFVAGDGGLRVTGAKFGHLPLPGALGRAFAGSRKDLKGVFAVEARILGNLEEAELRKGVLAVRTKGAE